MNRVIFSQTYSVLDTDDTARDRSQWFPQVSSGHVAGMFGLGWLSDEVLRVEGDRTGADSSPLVVRFPFDSRGFRGFIGTFAEELAEELILGRLLILGWAALTLLRLATFLRRLSSLGGRAFLRIFLVGCYQRLILEDRIEGRDDESRAADLLLDHLRLAELQLGLLAQGESEFLVPLRPGLTLRGSLEFLLAGD